MIEGHELRIKTMGAVVPNSDTSVKVIHTLRFDRLLIVAANHAKLLQAFVINGRAHPDAPYTALYTDGADFTSPHGAVVDASGDLTVLAANTTGWVILNVRGIESVELRATCGDAAGTTVDLYISGS